MSHSFLLKVFGGKIETIHHGQEVIAKLGSDSDQKTVRGKICINYKKDSSYRCSYDSNKRLVCFWVCSNEKDGCSDAHDKFEYEFSWVVNVDPTTHEISSEDCKWIKLVHEDKKVPVPAPKPTKTINPDVDDDPMPENWEPSEKDLIFFK